LEEYVFIPRHGTIFPSGSVTLVSSYIWWKTSWQTKAAKSFDICDCKIQNLAQCL